MKDYPDETVKNHRVTHRCVHGKILEHPFTSQCMINAGDKGWKRSPAGYCPWVWSISDCPKHENNKNYRY